MARRYTIAQIMYTYLYCLFYQWLWAFYSIYTITKGTRVNRIPITFFLTINYAIYMFTKEWFFANINTGTLRYKIKLIILADINTFFKSIYLSIFFNFSCACISARSIIYTLMKEFILITWL